MSVSAAEVICAVLLMVGSCVTDEIVQALCEAGARVDAEDSRGRTALQRAQDNKQEAAVSELRHRGA